MFPPPDENFGTVEVGAGGEVWVGVVEGVGEGGPGGKVVALVEGGEEAGADPGGGRGGAGPEDDDAFPVVGVAVAGGEVYFFEAVFAEEEVIHNLYHSH